jgi:hypothetical protein
MKFKLVYLLEDAGVFDTFKEAFKAMHKRITTDLKANDSKINWHLLETAVWIEATGGKGYKAVHMFTQARDRACEEGWLKDGKLVI